MRLIDADAFMHEMFDYSAPEMMWNKEDIIYKIGKMEIIQKEQEAQFVQNIGQQISCKSGLCPNCGKMLNTTCNKKFCGDCGQAVKWDD